MRNVLEYLEAAYLKEPEKTAYASETDSLTFRQVYMQARSVGTVLLKDGLYKKPVVVFMEKSPQTITAFLGVVYAGCYYVPVDEEMPSYRMELIFKTLSPQAVICDKATTDRLYKMGYQGQVYLYEQISATPQDTKALSAVREKSIDTDALYIVFTSGSTGIPKGVVACHRSVIDYIENLSAVLQVSEDTVFGNQAPLYFDNSVLDIFCTLKSGAYVYFLPQKDFLFPARMMDELEQRQINTLFWVPSALMHPANLGVVKDGRPRGIKRVFFCGEVMPNRQLNIWRRSLPDADFVNMYGPTEITDVCSWYRVDRAFEDGEPLPIGFPCENTRITLVDGEICVSGTCLSAGYYNAPEKTAAAFVQHPDARGIPERMYKTGDLGAYNERGELMFLGRKDSQIKKQGYRIELGEIECAIKACQAVTQGCCFYQAVTQQIVCCYSGEDDEKALRGELRRRLPKYMLPDVYYHLPQFPQTMNGKIDRVRLRQELGL